MIAANVGLIVVAIVAVVLLVNLLVWIPVLMWLRRRSDALSTTMATDVVRTGETVVIPPEPGAYRGGDKPFSAVKGNGVVMLTDRRLECRVATGRVVTIPVGDITGVRTATWFRRSASGGRIHLVVATASGAEVGFFVSQPDRWAEALNGLGAATPTDQ